MPAAKGGLKGVRRNVARDRAIKLVAQAHRESWGVERLAKEAKVSTCIASDVLANASEKVVAKVDRELGVLANQMREAAQTAVPNAIKLQQRTLSACERIIACLEADIERYGDAGIPGKHGETPASVVLAGAAKALAGAMATLGGSIKDLTGLKAAETVAVKRATADAGKTQAIDPWNVELEVLPSSE